MPDTACFWWQKKRVADDLFHAGFLPPLTLGVNDALMSHLEAVPDTPDGLDVLRF